MVIWEENRSECLFTPGDLCSFRNTTHSGKI